MALSIFNLIALLTLLRAVNSISDTEDPQKSAANHSHLDRKLIAAFAAQEKEKDKEKEEQGNQNKNQGLINTIVNHNNQLKHIVNKFNYIVNNYANTSHVKEISDKTKYIEKLVTGPPQPHNSWRELLLLVLAGGALVIILNKICKKVVLPRLRKFIYNYHAITKTDSSNINSISKYVQNKEQRNSSSSIIRTEEKALTQHEINTQLEKLNETVRILNDAVQLLNSPRRIEHP